MEEQKLKKYSVWLRSRPGFYEHYDGKVDVYGQRMTTMQSSELSVNSSAAHFLTAAATCGVLIGWNGLEMEGSKCSAYDCEFAALAKRLGVPLVTADCYELSPINPAIQ